MEADEAFAALHEIHERGLAARLVGSHFGFAVFRQGVALFFIFHVSERTAGGVEKNDSVEFLQILRFEIRGVLCVGHFEEAGLRAELLHALNAAGNGTVAERSGLGADQHLVRLLHWCRRLLRQRGFDLLHAVRADGEFIAGVVLTDAK